MATGSARAMRLAACGLLALAATVALGAPALNVTYRQGRAGVVDAAGGTRVPFVYDAIEPAGTARFIVAVRDRTRADAPRRFGVVDDRGRVIVPPVWAGIVHNRTHRVFQVAAANDNLSQGILDEAGRVVVPAVYDRLERISNMGDEPTAVALRGGKFGYVNIVTGQVMIPVEWDVLRIGSLDTDAEGRGSAVAARGGRWGVVSTDGSVQVPFDYDAIGEFSALDGTAIAERQGRLVELRLRDGRFVGESEVAPVYSSNFVPRPRPSLNAPATDGLFAAEAYPTMRTAWEASRDGRLHWAAIPSLQIDGERAYVAFGQFRQTGLPALPNVLAVRREATHLTLLDGQAPVLRFTASAHALDCRECEALGLPARWRRVAWPDAAQPFGGTGIAFSKASAAAPLTVTEVLADGPAARGGLLAGDVILRVDGADVAALTADAARAALRGPAGSAVRLHVRRAGQDLPAPLVVERAVIDLRR